MRLHFGKCGGIQNPYGLLWFLHMISVYDRYDRPIGKHSETLGNIQADAETSITMEDDRERQ